METRAMLTSKGWCFATEKNRFPEDWIPQEGDKQFY